MVSVRRDLIDHLIPTSLSWAGTPSTRPGCSKPIQPGFDHFQGGGIHSFSGWPAPVPHHPHSKECLPYISNLNLPSCSLKPLPLVLSLHVLVKSASPSFLYAPSGTGRLLQGLPGAFSRLNNPNSLSLSSWERCSSPRHFRGLLGTCSNRSMSFLCRGLQSWMQDSRWGLTTAEQRRRIPSLDLLALLL